MDADIAKILFTREEIFSRVQEIGDSISKEYNEVLAIGILKGATLFFSDLVRAIKVPVTMDFMMVSSYGLSTVSSGELKIKKDLEFDVAGKDVLIIEDIIDTGITMSHLTKILKNRGAKSIKIAAFLNKPARREVDVKIDYIGFNIPDEFVVGYGLDFAEKYRNLPYIGVLKREIYENAD